MTETKGALRRRDILLGGGAAALAGAVASNAGAEAQAAPARKFDHETDIVCVGGGAAGLTAAVTAVGEGAKVIVLEKGPILGGTTAKSGAVFWIPNNFALREQGIRDARDDCLRFLARFSWPEYYDPDAEMLGLEPEAYRLLEAFYDNGSVMTDHLQKLGALKAGQWRMWDIDRTAPDYLSHVPENKVPEGRPLGPKLDDGKIGQGVDLIFQFEEWLTAKGVPLLTEHRVTEILMEQGRVIGVLADHDGKQVAIRARKGVIFGTGGYAHNVELLRRYQPGPVYGSCAQSLATGDFITLAAKIGAKLGNMDSAWRTQVVFEETLDNRVVGLGAFFLPGDSMIMVDRTGKRVVNEKRNYNDRTRIHYQFNPNDAEYPNQFLFMIYDQRCAEVKAGNFPLPQDPSKPGSFIIKGETLDELAANLDARMKKLSDRTGDFMLDADFASGLKATVARFNEFARKGKDEDFGRGDRDYDRVWELMFGATRKDTRWPAGEYPNPVMYPFQDKGPYYAIILAPGVLDTNGGPVVNEHGQVIAADGTPIPGLYGAGNCIASPSRHAYYGAGGTIGLAMTFGYIAAKHAKAQKEA